MEAYRAVPSDLRNEPDRWAIIFDIDIYSSPRRLRHTGTIPVHEVGRMRPIGSELSRVASKVAGTGVRLREVVSRASPQSEASGRCNDIHRDSRHRLSPDIETP